MERLKASDVIQMSDNIYAPYYQAISKDPNSYMTDCVTDASVIGLLVEMDRSEDTGNEIERILSI